MNALVERVRMALAEAGYPDAIVQPFGESVAIDHPVPGAVAWRANEVAGAPNAEGGPTCCLACYVFSNETDCARTPPVERGWDCLARGEGVEDCGVERTVAA